MLGALLGMASGGLLALVHAYFSIHLRANQVISGYAINFLAYGLTGYLFVAHYGDNGTPGTLPTVPNLSLPVVKHFAFFGTAIGDTNVLTWVGLILVPIVWWFLFRTRAGLRLRAIGEQPLAASTVGLKVIATRYAAVIASGVLAALGGVYLADGFDGLFNFQMTDGRGFIALAAVIFGKWNPFGALAAVLPVRPLERARVPAGDVLRDAQHALPGAALPAHADRGGRRHRSLPSSRRIRHPLREGVDPWRSPDCPSRASPTPASASATRSSSTSAPT